MAKDAEYNISKNFFANFHQIKDANNHPLTNVYWSPTSETGHAYGCVYLIHGYGGSPIEPCMKVPMTAALARGFDVVAIEGVGLSATAEKDKAVESMTLERQKQALHSGLEYCGTIRNISHDYNIGWVHSISCRALSDLMVDSMFVRHYFNELILNNPYLLPPPKVQTLRAKFMQRDPSGESWKMLMHKVSTQLREIEQRQFKIPTCLYNLCIPLPPQWAKRKAFEDLALRASYFVKQLRLHFILGTADNMADYNQNLQIFNGLCIPNKQLVSIQGANHAFENALGQYSDFSGVILDTIRGRRLKSK